jgi:hypothetical protein
MYVPHTYRRWISCGCVAASALMLSSPAWASKYDAELAPVTPRVAVATPAPKAAEPVAKKKDVKEVKEVKEAKGRSGPAWLSGSTARAGDAHHK